MIKEIPCEHCHGTGKTEIRVCDECGNTDPIVGKYDPEDGKGERDFCQQCWAETLTDEEISEL